MPASSIPTTRIPSPSALYFRPRPLQSKTPWNTKSKKFLIHEFEITNLNTLSTGLDTIPTSVRGNQPPTSIILQKKSHATTSVTRIVPLRKTSALVVGAVASQELGRRRGATVMN